MLVGLVHIRQRRSRGTKNIFFFTRATSTVAAASKKEGEGKRRCGGECHLHRCGHQRRPCLKKGVDKVSDAEVASTLLFFKKSEKKKRLSGEEKGGSVPTISSSFYLLFFISNSKARPRDRKNRANKKRKR